jgi:hypothetical protein
MLLSLGEKAAKAYLAREGQPSAKLHASVPDVPVSNVRTPWQRGRRVRTKDTRDSTTADNDLRPRLA